MQLSGFALAVFALLAVFGSSSSNTTHKPTTRRPLTKPTTRKPLATTTKPEIDCTEFKFCTKAVQPVWATAGQTCVAFRNKCYFENEYCSRQLDNLTLLKETPRQVCTPLCNNQCSNNIDLQCGELNGQYRSFVNGCYMESYVCKTGETFLPAERINCGIESITQNS